MNRARGQCTEQVGRFGRTVAKIARDLDCDWHTVNDAVIACGSALIDGDHDRRSPAAGRWPACFAPRIAAAIC
jgi:hypothetical protein